MKIHAVILAFGCLAGATTLAQAQTAPAPQDPLEALQADFGKVVGDAFHAPDPVINAPAANAPGAPGPVLGQAFKTSLDVPGAVFAGILQPFAAADAAANPAPAPAAKPAHRHHRHAGGYHHVSPATAG